MLIALPRVNFVCSRCRNTLRNASRRQYATDARDATIPARTRFAPSPTGSLHLGSLRTALFNCLWAKKTGGQFILRIEDTDAKRTVANAQKGILDDLKWAGLHWDEGPEVGGPYGPYVQSERVANHPQSGNIYKVHAEDLMEDGHAYRCFCSADKLNSEAEENAKHGQSFTYPGWCSQIPQRESDLRAKNGEQYVIRLKDDAKELGWNDVVFGHIHGKQIRNDIVLLKSDGWPTYHLASVVDDHHMKISHVIRGVEWLTSTPKHVALYNAFRWKPPHFAHVGLLRDKEGHKLSKRELTFDLKELQQTILPEALLNFLVLLGWKQPGQESEVYTMKEMIEKFDLNLNNTNPIASLEKLFYLQPKHAKFRQEKPLDKQYQEMLTLVTNQATKLISQRELTAVGLKEKGDVERRLDQVFKVSDNFTSADQWILNRKYLLSDRTPKPIFTQSPSGKSYRKLLKGQPSKIEELQELVRTEAKKMLERFVPQDPFTADHVNAGIKSLVASIGASIRDTLAHPEVSQREVALLARSVVYMFLRAWIAWGTQGEGMHVIMAALGRDICLQRITENKASVLDRKQPAAMKELRNLELLAVSHG